MIHLLSSLSGFVERSALLGLGLLLCCFVFCNTSVGEELEHTHKSARASENAAFAFPGWEKVERVLSFRDYNTRIVFAGLVLLGVVSGITGTFLLLRKRSLLSDSVSHATLPGLALVFIVLELVQGKGDVLIWLLVGGAVTGVMAMVSVVYAPIVSKIKSDAALALSLTFFYGLGVVLLSVIQQMPTANASGLEYLIYGNAATLTRSDVDLILVVAICSLVVCTLLFKEFSILCFDSGYADTQGYSSLGLDFLLMGVIVFVSVVGLQAVGLLLMMALLITPAVAARFWAKRLTTVALVAGLLGGLSAFSGVLLSSLFPRLPTGAIIVLSATAFFLLSLFFGRNKGVVIRWLNRLKSHRRLKLQQFLRAAFDAVENEMGECLFAQCRLSGFSAKRPIAPERIFQRRAWTRQTFDRILKRAAREGWVRLVDDGTLMLTDDGLSRAQHHAKQHRLWELYLIRYADVAPSQVHQDVERIEEVASPDIVREIEDLFESEIQMRSMPQEPHPA